MKLDDKLAQAFKETSEERTERLMKIEKPHRFSLSYKLWERKMLCDLRRNRVDRRWTLRKAKYAVTVMFAALALFVGGSAYAAIVISNRFSFENTLDYAKLLVEKYPSDKTEFEEYYGLSGINGWEIRDMIFLHDDTRFRIVYKRGDELISFSQSIINDKNMGQFYDRDADFEMLSLYSENDGFIMDSQKREDIWICWLYDGYYFQLAGNLTKDEAIDLAYSIKIIDLSENKLKELLR